MIGGWLGFAIGLLHPSYVLFFLGRQGVFGFGSGSLMSFLYVIVDLGEWRLFLFDRYPRGRSHGFGYRQFS